MNQLKTSSILFFLLLTSMHGRAEDRNNFLVLYPKVNSEHKIIFSSIIKGIKNSKGITVAEYEVTDDTTPKAVESWISNNNGEILIVLGKRCVDISNQLSTRIPTIVGGIVTPGDVKNGVSLMGDPQQFLMHLTTIAPKVNRIHVVYNKSNSGWLIPKIIKAAKKYNLDILAKRTETTQASALAIQEILSNAENESDALWLLMDRIIPDNAILPSILETAWEKNLVVMSSNPEHVKRGVLFSLYPDNELMGQEIAILAMNSLNNHEEQGILPTKSLRSAINRRTASHLGLHISPQTFQEFDLIFPLP